MPEEMRVHFDHRTLRELSDSSAKELIQHRYSLELNSLEELTDSAAIILAQHRSHLSLNGLRTLSDAAAKALASHRGGILELHGLVTISGAAANALFEHPKLDWDFSEMTESLASSLVARSQDFLVLGSLTKLSDSVAQILSGFQGNLSLNGLTDLSDIVLDAFGQLDRRYIECPYIRTPSRSNRKSRGLHSVRQASHKNRSISEHCGSSVEIRPTEISRAD